MVVDGGAVDIGEGQATQSENGVVARHRTRLHVVEERPQAQFVHRSIVPRRRRNGRTNRNVAPGRRRHP